MYEEHFVTDFILNVGDIFKDQYNLRQSSTSFGRFKRASNLRKGARQIFWAKAKRTLCKHKDYLVRNPFGIQSAQLQLNWNQYRHKRTEIVKKDIVSNLIWCLESAVGLTEVRFWYQGSLLRGLRIMNKDERGLVMSSAPYLRFVEMMKKFG